MRMTLGWRSAAMRTELQRKPSRKGSRRMQWRRFSWRCCFNWEHKCEARRPEPLVRAIEGTGSVKEPGVPHPEFESPHPGGEAPPLLVERLPNSQNVSHQPFLDPRVELIAHEHQNPRRI